MNDISYPRLLRRVQAVFIDSVITSVLFMACVISVGYLGIANGYTRAALSLGIALSFEPLMVAFSGGTVGHHMIGLKVRAVNADKNINVIFAYVRFILKLILGLPSLVFILTTKKHQAIHDIASRAIVVHKNPELLPSSEILEERVEESGYTYPSIPRRLVVIVGYIAISFILISIASSMLLTRNCLFSAICTRTDIVVENLLSTAFLVGMVAIIVMGWKARLYGCRKRKRMDD